MALKNLKKILSDIKGVDPTNNTTISAIPHWRHTFAVSPPVICRHIVIFFPYREKEKYENPPDSPGVFDTETARKQVIALFKKIQEKRDRRIRKDNWPTQVSERETAQFEADLSLQKTAVHRFGSIFGKRLRMKADVLTEYCTISLFLDTEDQSEHGRPANTKRPPKSFDLSRFVQRWKQTIANYKPEFLQEVKTDSDIIYFAFWKAFDDYFDIKFEREMTGSIIGDFRGFSVSPFDGESARRTFTEQFEDREFPQNFVPIETTTANNPKELESDIRRMFYTHRPFFYSALGLNERGIILNEDARKSSPAPNLILCEMLTHQAIYGSNLGNPRLATQLGIRPNPVTYFIIYGGSSKNQLGSLIQRQHTLGELRVAALIDRETVMEISPIVRELGQEVTRLINWSAMNQTLSSSEMYGAVHAYSELGRKCHGGLLYRINRCAYYAETLTARLPHMRQDHIEGWQSYQRFVEVNLIQIFKSTASIGDRYRQLGLRLDRLVTIFHAERQRAQTNAVAYLPFLGLALTLISLGKTYADLRGTVPLSILLTYLGIVVALVYAMWVAAKWQGAPKNIDYSSSPPNVPEPSAQEPVTDETNGPARS